MLSLWQKLLGFAPWRVADSGIFAGRIARQLGGNCLDGVSPGSGTHSQSYTALRSPFLFFRLIFFLALSQITGDLVNRRFACQFIRRAILVIIDIQSFCDPLQYAQGPSRFSFGKEVDLEFEVVAPFQRLVNSALADQHAGSKQNSFESEDRREQGERIFIEGMVVKSKMRAIQQKTKAH